jgi:hypothetical protein
MKIRAFVVCLSVLSTTAPLAWADASSKAAKIAELMQLTGARQYLHEVDGKFDQEEAARAWGRFYSENVSESDLDGILAYYRSPAGQKDVSASRAALGQVQRYMTQKHAPITAASVANSAQPTAATSIANSAQPITAASIANSAQPTAAPAAASAAGSISSSPPPARPWASAPGAPDGRVVPSPSLPEHCEMPPTPAPISHAVPSSGRSVVCVCTDEKGGLTRDPVIAESSGDARVDSGAIKMARVDSGRYIPPALDGHPQSACFRFAIDFSHHQ